MPETGPPARPAGASAPAPEHHEATEPRHGHERVPLREYLRPAKWQNAARRRVFEYMVPRIVTLHPRSDVVHVGSQYGGWPVPASLLDESSVVYSVGAGGDTSFDVGLIERTGCVVHSFDPTPGAAAHVAEHPHEGLTFHRVAIWTHTGCLPMYEAANPENMALSAVDLQHTKRRVWVPCRTIEATRELMGHDEISLIKLTVDGGEYELIPQLDLDRWGTRVLVTALQHNRPPRAVSALVAELRARGFTPVARRNTGFTFVRADAEPRASSGPRVRVGQRSSAGEVPRGELLDRRFGAHRPRPNQPLEPREV